MTTPSEQPTESSSTSASGIPVNVVVTNLVRAESPTPLSTSVGESDSLAGRSDSPVLSEGSDRESPDPSDLSGPYDDHSADYLDPIGVVRPGDTGPLAALVNECLKCGRGSDTYNGFTRSKVMGIQHKHGLAVTGVVRGITWAYILPVGWLEASGAIARIFIKLQMDDSIPETARTIKFSKPMPVLGWKRLIIDALTRNLKDAGLF